MKSKAPARRHLDERLRRLAPLTRESRPHKGWVRAIRDALGMSGTELASRLGVSQPTVQALERSEVLDTIELQTLRRAADALDCDLVYVLVPRTSLQEAVEKQARSKASWYLAPIAHHGRLENQGLTAEDSAAQVEELAARLIDRRGLWSDDDATA